jgi:hypothetical protein
VSYGQSFCGRRLGGRFGGGGRGRGLSIGNSGFGGGNASGALGGEIGLCLRLGGLLGGAGCLLHRIRDRTALLAADGNLDGSLALGGDSFTLLDLVAAAIIALLTVIYIATIISDARKYAKIDPPKRMK